MKVFGGNFRRDVVAILMLNTNEKGELAVRPTSNTRSAGNLLIAHQLDDGCIQLPHKRKQVD